MIIALVILLLIISILVFIYFIGITKFKKYNTKIERAEEIIISNLDKKLDTIIDINTNIKKIDDKKEYLKEYIEIKNKKITNMEKDLKLDEASKLISNLARDYTKLSKDSDFNKKRQTLRELDELIVSAKNIYNENAILNNKLIKLFPYNIIGKISNYKVVTLYNNDKTEENEE